ncbi:hypothetical protein FWK35_00018363 [Aphis craccivora]|uniref:Uncharacterized protein n=2 Tax=Aphis craccivora TaxID=307492 RepID=A0A6G0Z8F3_APHCR|nr:hypothetical protein FWK35_00018363 [Aphis craccivora]
MVVIQKIITVNT